MTTPPHEFTITDFNRATQPALDLLLISCHYFCIILELNLLLYRMLTSFAATPDLALVSTSTGNESLTRNVFTVVECAFSQDHDNLMKKI